MYFKELHFGKNFPKYKMYFFVCQSVIIFWQSILIKPRCFPCFCLYNLCTPDGVVFNAISSLIYEGKVIHQLNIAILSDENKILNAS